MRSSGKNNRQSLKNNVLNAGYSRALAQGKLASSITKCIKCIIWQQILTDREVESLIYGVN